MTKNKDVICESDFFQNTAITNWISEQNLRTENKFAQGKRFQMALKTVENTLNRQARFHLGSHYDKTVYNFLQDDEHPYGILQRTTESSYFTAYPEWETVLDMDCINEEEDASWSYCDLDILYPECSRALIFLSSGGDACQIREFDLVNKRFIRDGFFLEESKSQATWINENNVLLALDAGGNTLTTSGYPRCISLWQRGTSAQKAILIYSGDANDLMISAWHDPTPDFNRTFIHRYYDLYRGRLYLVVEPGKLEAIDVPEDASCSVIEDWLLITLASDWEVANKTFPAGALLAVVFSSFQKGLCNLHTLFIPNEQTTLLNYSVTRNYFLINVMKNVVEEALIVKIENDVCHIVKTLSMPNFTNISANGFDMKSNRCQLISHGFLRPYCLQYCDLDDENFNVIKQAPLCFDDEGYEVTQQFAISLDGTRIPYFQVALKGLSLTGNNPTLLYGYGGFGECFTPSYLAASGSTWLQKGGVYVLANIRGGGEYGPKWHQAAIKQHRHRSLEDFAAVAKDLFLRKVTCPARLGGQGGSHGGLLIGNMLTDYPELFGALVCEVPLLDMINYPHLMVGSAWIAEYGDPNIAEEKEWLLKYSPYHKVSPSKRYPPILFTTGSKDDRVSPIHARKMVARMQLQGHSNVWFYEQSQSGHGTSQNNSKEAFYQAIVEEFLWQMLTEQ